MARHIDDDEVTDIIQRYNKGESATAIAKDAEVSPSTIHRLLNREGVKKKNTALKEQANKRLTEQDKAKLIKMYKAGSTVEEITKEVGCSAPTAYTYINKAGLSRSKAVDQYSLDTALALHSQKKYSVQEILDRTGISRATLYRAIKKEKSNREG